MCVYFCPSCALCFTVAETEESTVHLRGRSGARKTESQGLLINVLCVSVITYALCLQLQRLRISLLVLGEEGEPRRQDLKVCFVCVYMFVLTCALCFTVVQTKKSTVSQDRISRS